MWILCVLNLAPTRQIHAIENQDQSRGDVTVLIMVQPERSNDISDKPTTDLRQTWKVIFEGAI